MKISTLLAAFAMIGGSAAAAHAAVPATQPKSTNTGIVVQVDWACGPGYHIGRGGRRCWPNGRAPIEEIPRGYIVEAPLPAYVNNPPPILECPPGYHLGRGLRRCWRN